MHVLPFIMSLFMFIENKVINIKKKKKFQGDKESS